MKKRNLLEGSVLKNLLFLAAPIVLSNLLQIAYQLTDMFWIGKLGKVAVASISLAFPITFFFTSMAFGLTIAGSILVSQYFGKGDYKKMNHVVGQTLIVSLTLALLLSIAGYLLSPAIISLMGAEEAVMAGAIEYLQIYFIGNIFVFGFMAIQSLLRGIGEVKLPLFIVIGTVLLNLVADPFFINGFQSFPPLGIKGAAAATMLTQFLAFIIGIIVIAKGEHHMKLKTKELKPDFNLMKKIFIIGVPTSLEMSSKSLGMIMLSFIVAGFGTITTASYGIGAQIYGVAILPAIGIAIATSTMVGQGLGARKKDFVVKAAKRGILVSISLMFLLSVIIFAFAPIFAKALIDNPEVVKTATTFLRILSTGLIFLGIHQTINGILQGAGKTGISMILSITGLWAMQIPFAYIFSHFTTLGQNAIWLSYPVSFILVTLISLPALLKGDWKNKELIEEIKN